jgi:SM-20-related protein
VIELNPSLDVNEAAIKFSVNGRVHIPNVLEQSSALKLHSTLEEDTRWELTLNNGRSDFKDIPNLTVEQRSDIAVRVWERAKTHFQYLFDTHRLSKNGEPYSDPSHIFSKVVLFLNSPQFLSFVRNITGIDEIVRTDAQATRYRPGDFLTRHDDLYGPHDKRLAAYVINLTPVWRPDWGGILNFYNSRGHVAEGYVPVFNALNIFRIPAAHSVTQVSTFGSIRYSITGWFHG